MRKITVKNAPSERYDEGAVSNFLEYWEQHQSPDKRPVTWCRHCGEEKKHTELVGAHVIRTTGNDYNVYLVPSCEACNNHTNTAAFEVSEEDLILAP